MQLPHDLSNGVKLQVYPRMPCNLQVSASHALLLVYTVMRVTVIRVITYNELYQTLLFLRYYERYNELYVEQNGVCWNAIRRGSNPRSHSKPQIHSNPRPHPRHYPRPPSYHYPRIHDIWLPEPQVLAEAQSLGYAEAKSSLTLTLP